VGLAARPGLRLFIAALDLWRGIAAPTPVLIPAGAPQDHEGLNAIEPGWTGRLRTAAGEAGASGR